MYMPTSCHVKLKYLIFNYSKEQSWAEVADSYPLYLLEKDMANIAVSMIFYSQTIGFTEN